MFSSIRKGKWKLYGVVAGDWGDLNVPLAQGDYAFSYDVSYRLRASAQGDQVNLYINDAPILTEVVSTPDHSWGRFGLAADSAESLFDNVAVQGMP